MLFHQDFAALKLELLVRAKNGLDFIVAASIIWLLITGIWLLPNSPAKNSFFTLFTGGLMLPLAWLFSRVMKTTWTIATNPLQPLGLWLNFAQLFYFPILVFVYAKQPQHFIMTYAIITGAHFFPYAWFYNVRAYAVMAGVIAVGSMLIGWCVPSDKLYLIPVFVVCSLLVLSGWLLISYRTNRGLYSSSATAAAA